MRQQLSLAGWYYFYWFCCSLIGGCGWLSCRFHRFKPYSRTSYWFTASGSKIILFTKQYCSLSCRNGTKMLYNGNLGQWRTVLQSVLQLDEVVFHMPDILLSDSMLKWISFLKLIAGQFSDRMKNWSMFFSQARQHNFSSCIWLYIDSREISNHDWLCSIALDLLPGLRSMYGYIPHNKQSLIDLTFSVKIPLAKFTTELLFHMICHVIEYFTANVTATLPQP